jgi:RND family efflux transporter MFP subunit
MRVSRRSLAIAAGVLVVVILIALALRPNDKTISATGAAAATPAKSALTVNTIQPQRQNLTQLVSANGNIAAWQEASIGTEANGLRVAEVNVNVGDRVKKGQVLARFASETAAAELAETRATVAEAEATLAETAANAERARKMQAFFSAQAITQYLTAETTARARLEAQRAVLQTRQLHLQQTRVLAPDDGVISARSATVGAVLPAGQELFRLIRQGRLEWRAEVAASDLSRLKPGMRALLNTGSEMTLVGRVRVVAPTVDAQSRNGLVYVDLPNSAAARAGMFARGEFELSATSAMTLPQGAVILRDGFAYVMRVGDDAKVAQLKVSVGRRVGDRVEITAGLDTAARVVASGGAFLADGDTVRVVEAPTAAAK